MLEIRCSSIDRHQACPASAQEPALPARSGGEEADLGTTVHLALKLHVTGQHADPEALAYVAGVDPQDAKILTHMGIRLWNDHLSAYFPDPVAERPLKLISPPITLQGTADVFSRVNGDVRILDWKSGFEKGQHAGQLLGYALLGLLHEPDAEGAYVCLAHIRSGEIEGRYYLRQHVLDWWEGFKRELAKTPKYQPGLHCRGCPHILECPAQTAFLKQVCEMLRTFHELPAGLATPDLGDLLDYARLLEALALKTREVIKSRVAEMPGKCLPVGGRRELRIVEQQRRKIDFTRAWPILAYLFEAGTWEDAVTVSKTKIEDKVRALAPRGQKKAAVEDLHIRLSAAAAIETEIIERLECVPISEEITAHETGN